jgi:mannose-6-phosphate isomerase-like protein (cupin superfamily)
MMAITFLEQSDLVGAEFSRELQGDALGVAASIIFVDAAPGQGPSLHVHSYAELFFTLAGEATFTDGVHERVVRPGDVVIVPAEQPHAFVNSGSERLRQIDVHLSGRFATRWLDDAGS